MDYKEVTLSNGMTVKVDGKDFETVSRYNWYASKQGDRFYAYAWIGGKNVSMHRLLFGHEAGELDIDHRNGDGLDNRRENLRVATRSQNTANSRKQKGTSSKYKGVCVTKDGYIKGYVSYLSKHIHLGYFKTEEEAARAYDEAARKYWGEFAGVNFPDTIAA